MSLYRFDLTFRADDDRAANELLHALAQTLDEQGAVIVGVRFTDGSVAPEPFRVVPLDAADQELAAEALPTGRVLSR